MKYIAGERFLRVDNGDGTPTAAEKNVLTLAPQSLDIGVGHRRTTIPTDEQPDQLRPPVERTPTDVRQHVLLEMKPSLLGGSVEKQQ